MRVIAIANQKGGCGKTTTSINFAACLAFLNKKILLIDLDPQGHSTCGLGIQVEKLGYSLYDLLSPHSSDKTSIKNVLVVTPDPNLYILPTFEILSQLEEELAHREDKIRILKGLLQKIQQEHFDFEYVIMDCPPNLGVLTYNALFAADEVIVPIEPSFFSLHGLAKISETFNQVNKQRSVPIETHALLTLFNSRTCFAKEVYDEVKDHFNDKLFKSIIHESVTLKEAASAGQSIVHFDNGSSAFRDYLNLAIEYLAREWDRVLPENNLGWNNVMYQHFGPRKVAGGILFQVMSPTARYVEIAGDFNNWIPESLLRRSNEGLWQKVIPIIKGQYRYKFIIDGEWQVDPYQPVQRLNSFGSVDSYLELA